MEKTYLPVDEWVDKENVVSIPWIFFSHEKGGNHATCDISALEESCFLIHSLMSCFLIHSLACLCLRNHRINLLANDGTGPSMANSGKIVN